MAPAMTAPFAGRLKRLLLSSVLTVIASLPLFDLPAEIGAVAPFFVMFFALAALWLIPRLAWAVLGGLGYVAVAETIALSTPFHVAESGATIRPVSLIFADDWLAAGLALLGAAYLVRLAWSLITGRREPALAIDGEESDA
jgi:hypothetical protein